MRYSGISCLRLLNGQLANVNRQEQFVPKHLPVLDEDVKRLEEFLHDKPNIVVLTGAGISTESGKTNNRPPNAQQLQQIMQNYIQFRIRNSRLSFSRGGTVRAWRPQSSTHSVPGVYKVGAGAETLLGSQLRRLAAVLLPSAECRASHIGPL